MRTYLFRRLLLLIPTLFAISVVLFVLLRMVPGDAAAARLIQFDQTATQEDIDRVRTELGLTDPLWKQYTEWIGGVLQGTLGPR